MDLKKHGMSYCYLALGGALAIVSLIGATISEPRETFFLVSTGLGLMIIIYADIRMRLDGGCTCQ